MKCEEVCLDLGLEKSLCELGLKEKVVGGDHEKESRTWQGIDSGSHARVFNYENTMKTKFWKLKTPKMCFQFP